VGQVVILPIKTKNVYSFSNSKTSLIPWILFYLFQETHRKLKYNKKIKILFKIFTKGKTLDMTQHFMYPILWRTIFNLLYKLLEEIKSLASNCFFFWFPKICDRLNLL